MFKKRSIIFSIILLIFILCVGAAYAEENTTESIDLAPADEDLGTGEIPESQNNESEKVDPDFEIEFGDTYVPRWDRPEYPYLSIKMNSENLTADFSVFIDGEFYAKDGGTCFIENPLMEIPAPFCGLGNHTLEVQYAGDDVYNPLSKTHSFSVEEIGIQMMDETYVVDNDSIHIDMPGDMDGTVTLWINGLKVQTTKVTPKPEWDSQTLSLILSKYLKFNETYNITVGCSGKYGGKTLNIFKTGIISSVTYPLDFFINLDDYGSENLILLQTPKDIAKENINITIDNEIVDFAPYETDDEFFKQYTYYVNVSDYIGKHIILAKYSGDEKYPEKTTIGYFKVNGKINTPEESITYNSTASVNITLPCDATGNLTVYIKKQYGTNYGTYEFYKTQKLINGSANIDIFADHVGYYYLRVTYGGNYDVENITDYRIEVKPIISIPTTVTWGENRFITVIADNKSTAIVYFYIDGKLYREVAVINGVAKIPLSNLAMKRYYDSTYITYNDNYYIYDYWGYILTVKPLMKLTVPKPSVYYSENGYYYVKFYGYNGKVLKKGITITFKIGSKTFKAKTNERGIATLKLPNTITPGTYTLRALYNDFSISTKITVKQVLSLKAVTVKKSSKKLVLTATLKKGKTAIKNKYVTFKFNGKTYKAKTNKYGTAKVTIDKSVLNKLKVGKSIAYEVTYIKNKVKKTATVKR